MKPTIEIDARAAVKAIGQIVPLLERNVREALELGVILVLDEARRIVDAEFNGKGTMLSSIVKGPVTGTLASGMIADVSAGSSRIKYARFQEEGTAGPYLIPKNGKSKTGKALRWVGAGGDFRFARVVEHPGLKARRFMARALEAHTEDIAELVSEGVVVAIAEATGAPV